MSRPENSEILSTQNNVSTSNSIPSLNNTRSGGTLNLSVYYQNVRGVSTKINEIFNAVASCNYDVIAFTETWMNSSIVESELFPPNFLPFRSDRKFEALEVSKGGGVCLAFRGDMSVVKLDTSLFDVLVSVDIVGVKLLFNNINIYFFALYIPPKATVETYESLYELFSSLPYIINNKVFIIGDFNISEFSNSLGNVQAASGRALSMNHFMNFLNIKQINFIKNTQDRLLDLALTNIDGQTERAVDILTAEDDYHPALVINLCISFESKNNRQKNNLVFYNFKKANLVNLYLNFLNINWNFLDECNDVNTACEKFYKIIYEVLDIHVPKTKKRTRIYPPWFSSQIIKDIKKKYKCWKNFKKTKKPTELQKFKDLRKQIKTDLENSFKLYCLNIESDIKNDPKKFWRFINDKKNSHTLPNTMFYNSKISDSPSSITNDFSSFFESSFVRSSQKSTAETDLFPTQCPLDLRKFTEQEVFNILKKLKPKSIVGPDKIPSFLIKDCAMIFSRPLMILFNLSIGTSTFPEQWKISRIIPVFKKGDKSCITNYRPISIINNFSKVFEMILHEYLYSIFSRYISPHQHGFMKGRSTVSNLFCLTQELAEIIDTGEQIDVIYTDCSKAFDKLDHGILLNKISVLGSSNTLLSFFESYLTNRKQFVQCHGTNSREFVATSGVPQGSHLGPLFFNIFLNDLVHILDVKYLLYADDVKIYLRINSQDDCTSLQANLVKMNEWCKKNKLLLNISKCCVVSFTKRLKPIHFNYNIDDQSLARKDSMRDLGVLFDSKLSFREHINQLTSNCFRLLGFIFRNTGDFSKEHTFKILFNSLVRSRLEYSATVWSPFYQLHIESLEKIQRRFLKYLSFKLDGSYPEIGYPTENLLSRFSMESLEARRTKSQVIFLRNLLYGNIDCTEILQELRFQVPRPTSRSFNTFALRTPRTNVLKFSPLFQACEKYHQVQNLLDIFECSVASIKRLSF